MAATAAQPHSQLANVASPPWSEVDAEFAAMISPLHSLLSSNSISTSEAAESFVAILHSHLTRRNIIKNATGNFRHGPHRERGIVALTRRLAKVKNAVRSETGVSKPFLAAVRASLRSARQTLRMKSARQQEKSFRNNPWTFAKSVCEGSDA